MMSAIIRVQIPLYCIIRLVKFHIDTCTSDEYILPYSRHHLIAYHISNEPRGEPSALYKIKSTY